MTADVKWQIPTDTLYNLVKNLPRSVEVIITGYYKTRTKSGLGCLSTYGCEWSCIHISLAI